MHIGFHHYQKHQRTPEELNERQKRLNAIIDKIIYFVGSFGVFIIVPQLIKVWSPGDISGVSLFSWAGMLMASIFWLTYGLIHKAKPIIYINLLGGSVQFFIVLGILLHR